LTKLTKTFKQNRIADTCKCTEAKRGKNQRHNYGRRYGETAI
jgi:hypothetical protein